MSQVGVVFDFNGTMFLDTDKQEKAWEIFIGTLNRSEIFANDRLDIHGRCNREILSYLLGKDISSCELDVLSEQKEQIYRDLCEKDRKNLHLTRGLEDLLETLKEYGIPRTIATSSGKSNLDFYIERFDLEKWFDIQKIVYDNGTFPGKPAPYVYHEAAKNIGVHTGDCVVFEDSFPGIQAASQAGIGKIIVITDYRKREAFAVMPEVYDAITTFHDFDRLLLRNI
ncbi:MAG: HAD family hydrolase [Sphaerochaetaceae bacterium]